MPDTLEEGEKAVEKSEWADPSWRGKVLSSEKLPGSQAEQRLSLGEKDVNSPLPGHA